MDLDSNLVKTYQGLIKEHREIADKYQEALDDLIKRFKGDKAKPVANPETKATQRPLFDDFVAVPSAKPTFKTNLVNLFLKEKEPMTATIARSLYNEEYGTSYDKVKFSPKLSSAIPKQIKKYVIDSNPIETRNYYGLSQWFKGDDLKPEYIEKIKADRLGSQLM
jgi:hypothetical protein